MTQGTEKASHHCILLPGEGTYSLGIIDYFLGDGLIDWTRYKPTTRKVLTILTFPLGDKGVALVQDKAHLHRGGVLYPGLKNADHKQGSSIYTSLNSRRDLLGQTSGKYFCGWMLK